MRNIIILAITFGMLSGCASSVRKDVNWYESEISNSERNISKLESTIAKENQDIQNYRSRISKSKNSISNNKEKIAQAKTVISRSKRYLSSNSDVFVNGRCVKQNLGSTPKPYCESRSEAKEHALAYCSMSAGCDAAMLVASDELDTFSEPVYDLMTEAHPIYP